MKKSMNKLSYLLVSLLGIGILSLTAVSPTAFAAEGDPCGDATFLGFPAWYNGLVEGSGDDCGIKSPDDLGENGVSKFIWIIVFNVVEMILRLAGFAAVAFIIYGGYKYMISTGSPEGVAGAKKTITNAVIGLVISIAAVAIVNTVSGGMRLGG